MKKILLLLLIIVTAVSIKAQNGKPTKEETIEFILNTLKDFKDNGEHENDWGLLKVKREVQEISVTDCILIIKLHEYSQKQNEDGISYQSDYVTLYKINLKDIEGVSFEYGGKINLHRIVFKCKSKASLIDEETVFSKKKDGDKDYSGKIWVATIFAPYEPDKLIKAFNHLRKLCGAPEPIEF